MEQQIVLHPPSRETMRLIFELAIKATEHPNTKRTVIESYNYFEFIWMQEDQRRKEDDSKKPVTPPTGKSAVEEHGFESVQAQAKRNARKAKRLASLEGTGSPQKGKESA